MTSLRKDLEATVTLAAHARAEADRLLRLTGQKWNTAERFTYNKLLLDLANAIPTPSPSGSGPRLEAPEAVLTSRLGVFEELYPKGMLLSVRDFRARVSELNKVEFDKAMLGLLARRVIAMHHTDYNASLSWQDKHDYVHDPVNDLYYLGFTVRH